MYAPEYISDCVTFVHRVDNKLVRTCHPSGLGADRHCNDSDAKNDIGALCRHMLLAHGIRRQLKAALFVI